MKHTQILWIFVTSKYIMGEAMSIAENYDAAKMQALKLAKQLSQEQATSVTQSIIASYNLHLS